MERDVARVGARADGIEAAILHLDERLSRVEKRLDDLVAAEPRYALRADVQDLKSRMTRHQRRVGEASDRE